MLFANVEGLVGMADEAWPGELWLDVTKQAALLVGLSCEIMALKRELRLCLAVLLIDMSSVI
jgi:hypothetical protein